jgi:hypothetical protein
MVGTGEAMTDSKMVKPAGSRPKPPNAGKGRVKGVPNKVTGAVKDMVREALERAGGVEYLAKQAKENPTAFMTLVGKLVPLTANVGVGTLEELIAASMEAPK